MKPLVKNILSSAVLFLPIIFYGLLMFLNEVAIKTISKEVVFNFVVLAFILSFIFYIKKLKVIGIILLFIFYSLLFIQIGVLYTFYHLINKSLLFTTFETNYQEATDFVSSYVSWYYPLLFIGYLVLALKIIKNLSSVVVIKSKHFMLFSIFCLAVFVKFYNFSILLHIGKTYSEYRQFSQELSKKIAQPTSSYFTGVKNNEEKATYVVVVGESTSRRNMGLYEYYRDTNPQLSSIKDELYIYQNVISPRTHTILSLDRVFSMGNYNQPQNNELGTVFQLANQAGFKTYWLSNQQPLGLNESLVSVYAKATNVQEYVLSTNENGQEPDEILFPILEKTLQDKTSPKKMIFIHLMGTHMTYKNTYPANFNHFTQKTKDKKLSAEAHQIVNDYDNSIRYNDYVVSTIIHMVKHRTENSFVLYFSDHGDDVYQDSNTFGHFEQIGTNAMYEVPYIVWLSKKYKQKNTINFEQQFNRKYILDEFIHSFSELSRISFDQFDSKKSIFSKDFVYKKRLVPPGVNYDER